jgi:RES domain-containing protein
LITAYRISKKAFAATLWSGIGARDFGGRWNSKGIPVVYTSESRALAAMEQLVHLIKPRVLRGYVVASITFDDAHVQRVDPRGLPADWDNPVASTALKAFGDNWATALRYPVLAVPSAVIRGEWNYLFNPSHPTFAGYVKSRPVPFVYDPRLR